MSIRRLEPSKQFITRIVLLNRFHAPDEEDYSEAHHVLGQIHHGFPAAAPHQQSAYLAVRMMADSPFATANLRTAMDYVQDMLMHHGYDLETGPRDLDEFGTAMWSHIEDGDEDAAMAYGAAWFRTRIVETGPLADVVRR